MSARRAREDAIDAILEEGDQMRASLEALLASGSVSYARAAIVAEFPDFGGFLAAESNERQPLTFSRVPPRPGRRAGN